MDEERTDRSFSVLFDLLSSVILTRFAGLSGSLSTDDFAIVGEFSKEDRNERVSDKLISISIRDFSNKVFIQKIVLYYSLI